MLCFVWRGVAVPCAVAWRGVARKAVQYVATHRKHPFAWDLLAGGGWTRWEGFWGVGWGWGVLAGA